MITNDEYDEYDEYGPDGDRFQDDPPNLYARREDPDTSQEAGAVDRTLLVRNVVQFLAQHDRDEGFNVSEMFTTAISEGKNPQALFGVSPWSRLKSARDNGFVDFVREKPETDERGTVFERPVKRIGKFKHKQQVCRITPHGRACLDPTSEVEIEPDKPSKHVHECSCGLRWSEEAP